MLGGGGGFSPEPLDEPFKFFGLKLLGVWTYYGFKVNPPTPTPKPPGAQNPPKNEPNLNFLRNHLTNRDDFLNLSFYAYKLTSSLEVTPLQPTPSPPGLKKIL